MTDALSFQYLAGLGFARCQRGGNFDAYRKALTRKGPYIVATSGDGTGAPSTADFFLGVYWTDDMAPSQLCGLWVDGSKETKPIYPGRSGHILTYALGLAEAFAQELLARKRQEIAQPLDLSPIATFAADIAPHVKALWDAYEADPRLNVFQPREVVGCFPCSLDEWWHELLAVREEATERAQEVFDREREEWLQVFSEIDAANTDASRTADPAE